MRATIDRRTILTNELRQIIKRLETQYLTAQAELRRSLPFIPPDMVRMLEQTGRAIDALELLTAELRA